MTCINESEPGSQRLPAWLKRPVAQPGAAISVNRLLNRLELHTVCQSAKCPNRGECFSAGTATFLIMGDVCTRGCRFCAVGSGDPVPLDPDEPRRVAEAAAEMGLKHVVITTVTRDDVPDGGAAHFVAVIEAVRAALPEAAVEVLTSDFGGRLESVDTVAFARPDVFNHNLETVPRLYESVRPGADYGRSLSVLARASEAGVRAAGGVGLSAASGGGGRDESTAPGVPTKSGLMLGLGETVPEVHDVMRDLLGVGVSMLTLGQYLRPSPEHLPIAEFVAPEVFAQLEADALEMGFAAVASAPYVRSSYHAGEMAAGSS